MKNINFAEFQRIIDQLREKLLSCQLQEIYHFQNGIVLGFYKKETSWLVIDLTKNPVMLLFENHRPPVVKSLKPKPLTLFMSSNLKNRYLTHIEYQPHWGRRAIFFFDEMKSPFYFEVVLIPSYSNVIASVPEKKISWVKEQHIDFTSTEFKSQPILEYRSPQVLKEEWVSQFKTKESVVKDDRKLWEQKKQKDLSKKKAAIEKIHESLKAEKSEEYYQIGEYLKYHSLVELPAEWKKYVDLKKSTEWNRENIFSKAKGFEKKRLGALSRIENLEKEIRSLEAVSFEESLKLKKHNISAIVSNNLALRKLEVSPRVIAYMGKNAQDNMNLLKQSQPWDLWFHLKDYPSSHVIVRRHKNYQLTSGELYQVIEWFIKEALGHKKNQNLYSFDVIYTECRFVRPIKGDKIGRVHYSQEKNFHWKPRV